MFNMINKLFSDEDGQGLVEYSFILLLVAIVVIVALRTVGETNFINYNRINTDFPS